MGVFRYAASALAIAGSVAAQCNGDVEIQNSGDAAGLAACTTYIGDISIASNTTDNIDLAGIRTLQGSLIAKNATGLASLSADSLTEITDSFELDGLTILTNLNFPMLKKVDTIHWVALANLQGLSFTAGVEEINMLTIDNTQLRSLDGINLQVADVVYVANNNRLASVTMQLGNVTTSLTFFANGHLNIEFPNLEWANNMTFRDIDSIAVPSLGSVNGSCGIYESDLQSFAAPNLTDVGGTLSFVDCPQLTNISMPELTTVTGGFQIANNTKLEKLSGFQKLATVGGALDFNGEFNEVDLPALDDVQGAFNLQSTQNLDSICSHFQSIAGPNEVIQGTYTCSGDESTPGGAGTLPDGTSSGGGSGSSSSAAIPMLIPGATGVLGVVAAIFGML